MNNMGFFNPFGEGGSGGGGGGGTSNYNDLTNKPKINSVPLTGDKSLEDLGIVNPVVDSELSTTSENSVQNKVVTQAINEKLDIEDAVGKNTTGTEYTIDGQTVVAKAGAEVFNTGKVEEGGYVFENDNMAIGVCSHAEGLEVIASGTASHAEGMETKATGDSSHAEGENTTASGVCSHAEGASTTASGIDSHAEGIDTLATGDYSHAEGSHAQATGEHSHAEGFYTIAAGDDQHVQGKYNIAQGDLNTEMAFIIGNGTSTQNRSNAFAVDWHGKIYQGNTNNGVNLADQQNEIDENRAALIGQVDSGAKNLVNVDLEAIKSINTAGTWAGNVYTRYNIEFTVNADNTVSVRTINGSATSGASLAMSCKPLSGGTHILTGCPAGSNGGLNFDLRWGSSGAYRDFGDGRKISVTGSNNVYARVNNGIDIPTAVVYKPMMCTVADYTISPAFVPYAPTNRELYEQIGDINSILEEVL